jgi:hypothetical protein
VWKRERIRAAADRLVSSGALEPVRDPSLVGRGSVLAELPLSLQVLDGDLEPRDGVQRGVDVVLGRLQPPAGRVEVTYQVIEDCPEDGLVHQPATSADVNRHAIPRRNAGVIFVNRW